MKYALLLVVLLTSCSRTEPKAALLKHEPIPGEVFPGAAVNAEKSDKRTLALFHSRRAFPGAPPVIPHPIEAGSCLGCHKDGGYAPGLKAYTPVTPHPQYTNCQQCHVSESKTPLFVNTTFAKPSPPEIDNHSLPGAPPPIPHTLQLRENCNACHAGPAAVAEIRTPHPERTNCRQCHVQQNGGLLQ